MNFGVFVSYLPSELWSLELARAGIVVGLMVCSIHRLDRVLDLEQVVLRTSWSCCVKVFGLDNLSITVVEVVNTLLENVHDNAALCLRECL